MTRVDLEAAELMLDEATPGPWVVDDDDLSTIWGGGGSVVVCEGTIDSAVDGSTCDRDLIVAAPTLIRALIEEVRGLREAMPTDEERIAVAEARQQGQRWLSALTEATKDLAQVYEAIGPAWFHGDVSAAEASRRKTEALERLARGPS